MEIATNASAGHAIPGSLSDTSWARDRPHTIEINLRIFEAKNGTKLKWTVLRSGFDLRQAEIAVDKPSR